MRRWLIRLKHSTFGFFDPRYREPLLLAANFDASAETIYQLYLDRWPVEQLPLAAKQMIGLHRHFVSNFTCCWRLPELALLAGNMLTHVAMLVPALPTGFWDRRPKQTPGRLRRALGKCSLPENHAFHPRLRPKASKTDHLPKGVEAHRRQKASVSS